MSENIKMTHAERLLIHRRRVGITQTEAAKANNVPRSRYVKMENGQIPITIPIPRSSPLKPHEKCVVYRRRAKQTQDQIAQVLGVCRYTVNQMEKGLHPCDDLLWYWEQ